MEEVIKEIENISITNILPNFIKKMTEKQLEDEIKIIQRIFQFLVHLRILLQKTLVLNI